MASYVFAYLFLGKKLTKTVPDKRRFCLLGCK